MKFKILMVSILVFFAVGISTVFADDLYTTFQAKKVNVTVNNNEIASPGLIVQSDDSGLKGKTMLPLRDIANALQALVIWDGDKQTVRIYKPNVHITLWAANDKKPFGIVNPGKFQFQIFSQIDNLDTAISDFKMTITDPDGNPVQMTNSAGDQIDSVIPDQKSLAKLNNGNGNFWYLTKPLTLNFKKTGNYVLNFYMKANGTTDYSLVSQKNIQCVAQNTD